MGFAIAGSGAAGGRGVAGRGPRFGVGQGRWSAQRSAAPVRVPGDIGSIPESTAADTDFESVPSAVGHGWSLG